MKKSQLIQLVKEELRGWSPQVGQTKGLTPKTLNKILMKIASDDEYEPEGEVEERLKEALTQLKEEKPGLWANIRAKRARGEKPAHKNSKAHKDAVAAGKKINAMSEGQDWPKGTQSRYQEYSFKLVKVMPDRAKYSVADMETGDVKGTVVFNTVDQLHDYAGDLIKPQGGRQSTHLGEDKSDAIRWFGNLKYYYSKAFVELRGEDRETYRQMAKDYFSKL